MLNALRLPAEQYDRASPVRTPSPSSTAPRPSQSHSPEDVLPSAPRPVNWANSHVRIALNLRRPPAAAARPQAGETAVGDASAAGERVLLLLLLSLIASCLEC